MDPEKEILKKKRPVMTKLSENGFIRTDHGWLRQEDILDHAFTVSVLINDHGVFCSCTDPETNEEYLPIRLSGQLGSYASAVREAYCAVIQHIADTCFEDMPFIFPQANRISAWIYRTYHDEPTYPFHSKGMESDAGFLVNGKWYALILHISREKLGFDSREEVEILNLKNNDVAALAEKEGIWPAYHMNHTAWLSITLDDTLSDQEIEDLIRISHALVESKASHPAHKTDRWIIPSNPKYFDIVSYYKNRDHTSWKHYSGIKVSDIVYIYVGAPYQAIMYRCTVDAVKDGEMYMTVTGRYDPSLFPRKTVMSDFGVTCVRGPRYMPAALEAYITKTAGRN